MRILREILTGDGDYFRSDRTALDNIARRLGIHRNTVSERVRRMETNGFMLPLTVDVEPGAVGLVAVAASLDVPLERRNDATREALFALDGVWGILTFLDAWQVLLYAPDEATARARIAEACAAADATLFEVEANSARDYPDIRPVELSPLDIRIIGALLRNARAPFRDMAAGLGVTAKTVERRYRRLMREGVVTMMISGWAGASGLAIGELRAELPDDPAERATGIAELTHLLPNYVLRVLRPRGLVHFALYAPSTSELDDVAMRVRMVPQVRRVGLRIWTGAYASPRHAEWLLAYLRARAAATIDS